MPYKYMYKLEKRNSQKSHAREDQELSTIAANDAYSVLATRFGDSIRKEVYHINVDHHFKTLKVTGYD